MSLLSTFFVSYDNEVENELLNKTVCGTKIDILLRIFVIADIECSIENHGFEYIE